MRLKVFKLSRFDMYAAYRAGRTVSEIALIAGCNKHTVYYWVKKLWKEYENNEAGFRAWLALRRLVRHKGCPELHKQPIPRPRQIHNYIFHGQWGSICHDSQCKAE